MGATDYYNRLAMRMRDQRNPGRSREAEARRKVQTVMLRVGATGPPINLNDIAARLDVGAIRLVPLSMRGRLMLEGLDIVLEINQELSPLEQRFTIAHELCHLMLDDGRVSKSTAIGRSDRTLSTKDFSELERLCDVGAIEVLMPADWIRSISLRPPSFDEAVGLAARAEVDFARLAKRLIEEGAWVGRLVWFRLHEGKPVVSKAFPEWEEDFLARMSLIGSETLVEASLRDGSMQQGNLELQILGESHAFHANCLPVSSGTEAVALLKPVGQT